MWDDLFELLADMQEHLRHGEKIELCDDVMRMVVGFISEFSKWEITLHSIQNTDKRYLNAEQRKTFEKFRTLEGRRELCGQV